MAQRIVACGFKLGIGGVVTYKNSGLSEVLPRIGLQHLVLETDAPFLPPVPYRGKRNESSYIPVIGAKVAEILGCELSKVAEITTANTCELFKV
jgi:TatD DNase family protein